MVHCPKNKIKVGTCVAAVMWNTWHMHSLLTSYLCYAILYKNEKTAEKTGSVGLFANIWSRLLTLNSVETRPHTLNLVFKTRETFSTVTSLKLILFNASWPTATARAWIWLTWPWMSWRWVTSGCHGNWQTTVGDFMKVKVTQFRTEVNYHSCMSIIHKYEMK